MGYFFSLVVVVLKCSELELSSIRDGKSESESFSE